MLSTTCLQKSIMKAKRSDFYFNYPVGIHMLYKSKSYYRGIL